ncbi:MAG: hypothetical protein AB7O52_05745 [Planctomycetota bacterium]
MADCRTDVHSTVSRTASRGLPRRVLLPRVAGVLVVLAVAAMTSPASAQSHFVRGDCNRDGQVDIADPVLLLGVLFPPSGNPTVPGCLDACDANDDETVDVADPVTMLTYLFAGGSIPQPFPNCGADVTAPPLGPTFGCLNYPCVGSPNRPPFPILSPHSSLTNQSTITISGTAAAADTVEVITSDLTVLTAPVTSGSWSMTIPLISNFNNRLFFAALDGPLRSAIVSTQVVVDNIPPVVIVDLPPPGFTTIDPTVSIVGSVLDNLSGTGGITVQVAGSAGTTLFNLGTSIGFTATLIPLLGPPPSTTTIVVTVTDAAGNTAVTTTDVTQLALNPLLPSLSALLGGQFQTGLVNETLPEALEVQVLDASGLPLADQQVSFAVTRGNGTLAEALGGQGAATLSRFTDENGIASVLYTLGSDAGSQRVEAISTGVQGRAIFVASALAGPAQRIVAVSGDQQVGETETPMLEPLKVRVLDEMNNAAGAGVSVTFQVVQGDGSFAGSTSFVTTTNANGVACAEFELGGVGNHAVTADFAGNVGLPELFTARAVARDPIAATRFVGHVVEGSRAPLGGASVTLSLAGNVFTTTTDAEGQFALENLTIAGAGVLDVDGSTVALVGSNPINPFAPWSYPSLHYTVLVVPEATMSLPFPVMLPRMYPANERSYSTTLPTVLEIDGLEGLLLTIAPGSMTIGGQPAPEGTPVSINLVQTDSVPMKLPDGTVPGAAFTLKPSNAHFDPPIQLCYPNVDGLEPGRRVDILSFDHETSRFETVGFARVASDGAFVKSELGSGLPIGGWHVVRRPLPTAWISGTSALGLAPNCEVSVAGQLVLTNADGSFRMPYRVQDTVSGDWVCVQIRCPGTPDSYFSSSTFLVQAGMSYVVPSISPIPGAIVQPSSVRFLPASVTLTTVGATTIYTSINQPNSFAFVADVAGTPFGYNTNLKSAFTSSNPAIASVDSQGVVTAHSSGVAFITGRNTGAVSVGRVNVITVPTLPAVSGRCVGDGGSPLAGIVVTGDEAQFSTSAVTNANGEFTLTTPAGIRGLLVQANYTDTMGCQASADRFVTLTPGTAVNVGTLTLLCTPSRYEFIPDSSTSNMASIDVLLDNGVSPCDAYQFSLCFDNALMQISQVQDLVLPFGTESFFFSPNPQPSGADIGCLFDGFGLFQLPVGLDRPLCRWEFLKISAATSIDVPVSFCNSSVLPLISVSGGVPHAVDHRVIGAVSFGP